MTTSPLSRGEWLSVCVPSPGRPGATRIPNRPRAGLAHEAEFLLPLDEAKVDELGFEEGAHDSYVGDGTLQDVQILPPELRINPISATESRGRPLRKAIDGVKHVDARHRGGGVLDEHDRLAVVDHQDPLVVVNAGEILEV